MVRNHRNILRRIRVQIPEEVRDRYNAYNGIRMSIHYSRAEKERQLVGSVIGYLRRGDKNGPLFEKFLDIPMQTNIETAIDFANKARYIAIDEQFLERKLIEYADKVMLR